jgi:hypothetical protein
MNAGQQIVNEALRQLAAQTPVEGVWKPHATNGADGKLLLKYKGKTYKYMVEVKQDLRHYHLGKILEQVKQHHQLMVVAGNILPGVKKALRENQVNYIQMNGNAYIQNDQLFVLIDTNEEIQAEKPANRAFMKTGLKAIFHLLNFPEATNDSYRKLASDTDVALGNIKYLMDGLREANFILNVNAKTIRLKNMPALLDRWVMGYREVLRPSLLLGTYTFDKVADLQNTWKTIDIVKAHCLWGGEPAADLMTNYLRPNHFDLYTNQHKIQTMLSLNMKPAPEGEVALYRQFWNRSHYTDTNNCVPPLLVYTDLLLTDDPRCIDAAHLIYEQYLKENVEAYK